MIRFRLKKQREVDSFYNSIPMYDNLKSATKSRRKNVIPFAYLNLAARKLYKRFDEEI